MAKIVSPVWSIISGSIAGTTYFTTPAGQIIARQRTSPVQPVGPRVTAVHNAFTESVSDWLSLSTADRQGWDAWAAAHAPGKSGRELFIGGKSLLRYCNELPLPNAPVIAAYDKRPDFVTPPSFSLTLGVPALAGTGISVKITNAIPVACYYIVEFSPPFAQTRNFWKGPWNPAYSDGMAVTASGNTSRDFLLYNAGDRVFVRVRGVTNDNTALKKGHVVTAPVISYATVVTVP